MAISTTALGVLLLGCIVHQSSAILDNAGTEFVVMFMDNIIENPTNLPLELFITTKAASANYMVTSPGYTGTGADSYSGTVLVGQVQEINIDKALRHQGSGISNKGIRIQATEEVIVYGVNKEEYSTDAFVALPIDVLGKTYYAVSYAPPTIRCQFGIVGVDDNTQVTITFPPQRTGVTDIQAFFNGATYTNGGTFTTTINSYQTLQIQSMGDLTGTKVESTKNIAMFSGNIRTSIQGDYRDHLVEQLPPVESWGKEFITTPIPNRNTGDIFRIIASEAGTTVSISGLADQYLYNASDFVELNFPSGESKKISASNPILVIQFVISQQDISQPADPAMIAVPPIEQYGADYYFTTTTAGAGASSYTNYFLLVIEDQYKNYLYLDGNLLYTVKSIQWQTVPGTSPQVATTFFQISDGAHTLSNSNPTVTFGGILYGAGDKESYAMPIGQRLERINVCQQSASVLYDGVDNDCDGKIDEETCYNGLDEDLDGRVDEDCGFLSTTTTTTAIPASAFLDNAGTDFLIMFMDNIVENPTTLPLELFITTKEPSATFSVTSPGYTGPEAVNFGDTLFIGQVKEINIDNALRHQGSGISNKAIRIQSNAEVIVYGVNKEEYSTDSFMALPIDVLGRNYYAVSYAPPTTSCEFGIVGVVDNTQVTITFPPERTGVTDIQAFFNGAIYTNGGSFTTTINRFQTLQLQSVGDLTGTRVVATQNIAMFSGNVRTSIQGESRDHLVEQLAPVESWGKEFITTPIPNRNTGDIFRIIASEAGTTVSISGLADQYLFNAGDFVELNFPSGASKKIVASSPILLAQFIISQQEISQPADPAMISVPPIEQYENDYSFSTTNSGAGAASYTSYFLLVIEDQYKHFLYLDGQLLYTVKSVQWQPVPGTSPQLVTTFFQVGDGAHTLTNANPVVTFGGILYGAGDKESYAMPIGQRLEKINQCQPTVSVLYDQIDNDCDGRVDEEMCYDGLDNDFDSLIDEDCGILSTTTTMTPTTTYRPTATPKPDATLDNVGTEFLLMFMDNIVESPAYLPLELWISTRSTTPVDVVVWTPAWTAPYVYERRTIFSQDIAKVKIDPQLRMSGDGLLSKAISVIANEEVVVYGLNKEQYSTDAFLALPTNVVGTEYYTVSYAPPTTRTEFGLVGISDNTDVAITFARPNGDDIFVDYGGVRYNSGQTLNIRLNRYDTFQLQSTFDLTGTHIMSTAPISAFSGNVRTSVGSGVSRDHLVEQLTPVNSWGRRFVTVPIPGQTTGDLFRIVASRDNTRLDITNKAPIFIARAGDYVEFSVASTEYTYIHSDHPILVAQIVQSERDPNEPADPSLVLVQPVEQYINQMTYSTFGAGTGDLFESYVLLVVENFYKSGILLENIPLEEAKQIIWNTIPGSVFVGTTFSVPPGTYTLRHTDPHVKFGGIMYGVGDRQSYALPVGMNVEVIPECVRSPMSPADGIDNDCDGLIDEEICVNHLDDDNDGSYEEDCSQLILVVEPEPDYTPEPELLHDRFCYGTIGRLQCRAGEILRIVSAHFGRVGYVDEYSCGKENPTEYMEGYWVEKTCPYDDVSEMVTDWCQHQPICTIDVSSPHFGELAMKGGCNACVKYVDIHYMCLNGSELLCSYPGIKHTVHPGDFRFDASSVQNTAADEAHCAPFSFHESLCESWCSSPLAGGHCHNHSAMCEASNVPLSAGNTMAWCPEDCDRIGSYVQIDLGATYNISGVILQGRRKWEHWIAEFAVWFSIHGNDWHTVNNTLDGHIKVFHGNTDARAPIIRYFDDYHTFVARYIRIQALNYHGYPAGHVEFLRCRDVVGCAHVSPARSDVRHHPGYFGDTVDVQCDDFWATPHSNHSYTAVCTHNGWSYSEGCTERYCYEPHAIDFGEITSHSGWVEGHYVNYTCDVGYLPYQDRDWSYCTDRGAWTWKPRCLLADCGPIPYVEHSLHDGRHTKNGSYITYYCNQGYEEVGNQSILCQPDGYWTTPPVCLVPPVRINRMEVGDVRAFVGVVEIYHDRLWKYVCGDEWGTVDATIACNQLGFPAGYGYILGLIQQQRHYMRDVSCEGDEENLVDCSFTGFDGVTCNVDTEQTAYAACFESDSCSEGNVRLYTQGFVPTDPTYITGRAEVCHNGVWGTISSQGWTTSNSDIFCQQLGYIDSISYTVDPQCVVDISARIDCGYSGINRTDCIGNYGCCWEETTGRTWCYETADESYLLGPIWMDRVACAGSESEISDCPFGPNSNNKWGDHNPPDKHTSDIVVTCLIY